MKSKLVLFFLCFTTFFSIVALASEKDIYEFSWLDPDKEVYVLQNRKYRKIGRIFLDGGYGKTTSGAFVDATALQARLGYFITEEMGLEGIYSKNSGKENDSAKSIRTNSGSGSSTPFRRIVDNYKGVVVLWSPFYSKINTFNKIIYMDWIFGLGYAQLTENNNKLDVQTGGINKTATKENHSGILWEAGMKFYLNTSYSVRADLTAIHYKALPVTGASTYYSNFDATLSFGYSF